VRCPQLPLITGIFIKPDARRRVYWTNVLVNDVSRDWNTGSAFRSLRTLPQPEAVSPGAQRRKRSDGQRRALKLV